MPILIYMSITGFLLTFTETLEPTDLVDHRRPSETSKLYIKRCTKHVLHVLHKHNIYSTASVSLQS